MKNLFLLLSLLICLSLQGQTDTISVSKDDSLVIVTFSKLKRVTVITDAPPVDTTSPVVRKNVIMYLSFEGSNPFGSPVSLSGHQYCCSYSITQSGEQARAGNSSMKIDLRKTDATVSQSKRAEIEETIGTPKEGIRWYGGSWYLPATWTKDGFAESLIQWHDADGTTPPFCLCIYGGHLYGRKNINGNATDYDLGLITDYESKWTDIVMQIKWTNSTTTGFIKIWVNGVQKLNLANVKTNSNDSYLKIGMNKWNWYDSPNSSTTTRRVFYMDEFREGNELATYNDVAPKQIFPTPN